MVQRALKFTPEILLSATRRSAGVPNPEGSTVVYTFSSYSFETHKKYSALRVLEVKSGAGLNISEDEDISDANWLDEDNFAVLCAEKDGTTSLCIMAVPWDRRSGVQKTKDRYVAGKIDAPASNLKLVKLDKKGSEYAVVVSAQAAPDGSLFNADKARKTQSTGRLYSKLYVRHWDRYETKEKNALFYGKLSKDSKGKFKLSKLTNALKDTGLECPILPFGGTDNFDICHNCIIFVAKDPDLNEALNTKTNVYILQPGKWDGGQPSLLQKVVIPGFEGASTCPVMSPDGSKAAFLSMKKQGYEADKNHIFVLPLLSSGNLTPTRAFSSSSDDDGSWDRSPGSVCFTADGESLLVTAEEYGYGKLFMVDSDLTKDVEPRTLTEHGYITDVQPLDNGQIFISASSLIDNSFFAILDPLIPPKDVEKLDDLRTWTNSLSNHGSKFGLVTAQVSSIWTPSSNPDVNKEVHSFVMKPSHFDEKKKYPVAYLIHGGPQGSWADSWSTRWNPAVFAEQGYIVVSPNPTGSTGYGQQFTDSIRQNWGGDPYQDIVNCFEWVGKNMPEADNDRAVALGASYGGYMMNWIQGHNLGRKFKALVCHDGIFSTAGMVATEELYFPFQDMGSTPWYHHSTVQSRSSNAAEEAQRNFGSSTFADWRKWDPSEHLSDWATPELVIHSSKDFRICMSDGLAAFNVLQARGIDSQFLTFPDENHWVLKPENSLAWHKIVLNWVNKYAGLPAFTNEDPDSDEFWGGVRQDQKEGPAELMSQGKPET